MQNKYFVLCCSILTSLALNTANAVVKVTSSNTPPNKEKVTTALANIAVPFEENRGQADAKVAFQAKTLAGPLFVTKDGELVWSLNAPSPLVGEGRDGGKFKAKVSSPPTLTLPHKGGGNLHQESVGPPAPAYSVVEKFVGGAAPKPTGKTAATTQVNYFHGNDKSKWHSGVPTWQQVSLGEVWPGIEVSVAARGNNAEKLFTVAPGADVSKIAIEVKGGELAVAKDGSLQVSAPPHSPLDRREVKTPSPVMERGAGGEVNLLTFTPPIAYQFIHGERKPVQVAYHLKAPSPAKERAGGEVKYGFTLGAYDPTQPVVIDPLIQSTYLGGSNYDDIHAIAVTANAVYVTGRTVSYDFPGTSGGTQASNNNAYGTAYVAKLSLDLRTLIQSTYLGGSSFEEGYALAITSSVVYLAGRTGSYDFPGTSGGAQAIFGGYSDVFIAKLSLDLKYLIQASYLGGSDRDQPIAISVTNSVVYVAGDTGSSNFPGTSGAAQASFGGGTCMSNTNYLCDDVFIAKLSLDLKFLTQASFLGGSNNDFVFALAVTSSGVYVAGQTHSSNFPVTSGAMQASLGGCTDWGCDAFIAKLNVDLTNLSQASYLGGSSHDSAYDLSVTNNAVYVVGTTGSDNFPGNSGGAQATCSFSGGQVLTVSSSGAEVDVD